MILYDSIQSKLLRTLFKTMLVGGHLLSRQSRILGTFSIWVTKTQQESNSPLGLHKVATAQPGTPQTA